MDVRDLISELTEYEMGSNVELAVSIGDDTESLDFEVEDNVYTKGAQLVAAIEGHSLVENGRLEELLDKEAELEDIRSM